MLSITVACRTDGVLSCSSLHQSSHISPVCLRTLFILAWGHMGERKPQIHRPLKKKSQRDFLSLGFSFLLLSLLLLQEKQTCHVLCFPDPNVEAFWDLINQPPVLLLTKPRDLIRHSGFFLSFTPFVSRSSARQSILLPLRLSVGGWCREEAVTPPSRAVINTRVVTHTSHISFTHAIQGKGWPHLQKRFIIPSRRLESESWTWMGWYLNDLISSHHL